LRLWCRTVRYSYRPIGPNVDPRQTGPEEHYVYAFWHETLALVATRYRAKGSRVLISKHADGDLIAGVCRAFGCEPVRGSTTRGGAEAIRQILHTGPATHLGITPDGPRGPRRVVQMGVVYLASRLGLPLAPAGFGFERPWRAKS